MLAEAIMGAARNAAEDNIPDYLQDLYYATEGSSFEEVEEDIVAFIYKNVVATEKLANVREDVKERDKELIDNPEFAITIGKATYTERVDGGTMMLEAISKCKTGETTARDLYGGYQ